MRNQEKKNLCIRQRQASCVLDLHYNSSCKYVACRRQKLCNVNRPLEVAQLKGSNDSRSSIDLTNTRCAVCLSLFRFINNEIPGKAFYFLETPTCRIGLGN